MVKINCSHLKMVKIEDLKPNPQNPNKHPQKQVERLAGLIKHHGWRRPITVSKRSGLIVRGHGELEAAKFLKLKEVPVDIQNYKSKADEHADLIADNRIAELSETDYPMLKDMIVELDDGSMPLELTGFDDLELKDIFDYEGLDAKINEKEVDENIETENECPKCGYKWS